MEMLKTVVVAMNIAKISQPVFAIGGFLRQFFPGILEYIVEKLLLALLHGAAIG
ncbi:hypothetical protein D3C73_1607330 [compost metagenome]